MKKINNFIVLSIISFALYSCSDDSNLDENDSLNYKNRGGLNVSSKRIDNGIASNGNNILVFESKIQLEEVLNDLISRYDLHNTNLDGTIPSDLEGDLLEDYFVQNNLNEDLILDEFENNLSFKSLRRIINEEEIRWLEKQGDEWDKNTDPDNFFIASDFDRTFLNEGAEIIIKKDNGEEFIHKYFDWGDITISINDLDLLKKINLEKIYEPAAISKISDKIKINVVPQYSNSGCRQKGHHVDYYYVDGQRIKCFTTQNVGFFDNTFVAKTKGYYKTRRGWKNRRVWIIAGVSGLYRGDWTAFNNCSGLIQGKANWADKKRYKLEYRLPINSNIVLLSAKDNLVYSYHAQGARNIFIDFYDYNPIPW